MAIVKNKAKVGDYVKVIKKLPYKDQMDVELGDIGVVNYVASTGKYSVHIDGKKNPKDKDAKSRAYGKLYDFWIPFECCKVIDSEELTKQCLFENADALDNCITISSLPIDTSCITVASSFGISSIQNDIDNYFTKKKESEENKMKEIKNQKVIDLYFKRRKEALNDEFDAIRENIKEVDSNYIFIKQLKDQFNEYIEKNEIKDVNTNTFPVLSLTEESMAKCDEAFDDLNKKINELNDLKEEIIALLSGCDTYEQEMVILKNYGIVTDNNKMVSLETN